MTNYFRVIQASSDRYTVLVDGLPIEMIARKKLKKSDARILVGDLVQFSVEANQSVIEEVHPRKNILIRPHVANVDGIVSVVAETPLPDLMAVDKLSYNCVFQNIDFIICINKIDLASDNFLQSLNTRYKKVADNIVQTCAITGRVDSLYYAICGKLYALAGQSGVGKSSIINSLLASNTQNVGNLSGKSNRGKHTTTSSKLFSLDVDTFVVDTPGFSMLDTNLDIPAKDLSLYLPDFDDFKAGCKFSSCTHTSEQICGIKQAVSKGLIDKNRYENYSTAYFELLSKQKNKF